MTASDVVSALTARGASKLRQKGSHAIYGSACRQCQTVVPMHRGDIPTGTLRAIERHMAGCYGAGWLLG